MYNYVIEKKNDDGDDSSDNNFKCKCKAFWHFYHCYCLQIKWLLHIWNIALLE